MHQSEFSIIERFFSSKARAATSKRNGVQLGIGDDCAVLNVPEGNQLASSMDTLNAGVHFPEETDPFSIGYKCLAVNLSDLAAMGAEPAWVSLSLSLPEYDEPWLHDFSEGFFTLANEHDIRLIGGDTTRGPLSISVHVMGWLPANLALKRSGAIAGNDIYISGNIGDAGVALKLLTHELSLENVGWCDRLVRKLNQPEPRIALGLALREVATSAIDVSDGLLADLKHILDASGVGAVLDREAIPLSDPLISLAPEINLWELVLNSGDDYELLFTASPDNRQPVVDISQRLKMPVTRIGEITAENTLNLIVNGKKQTCSVAGFDHFRFS